MLLGLGDFIYDAEEWLFFIEMFAIHIIYKDQECPDKNIGKIR